MSLFNFKVSTDPQEHEIDVALKIAASTLSISLVSVGDFSFKIVPDGNIAQKVLTTTLNPLAEFLASYIPEKVQEAVKELARKSPLRIHLGSPLGYDLSVRGIRVRVEAEELSFSNYKDMLMAAGSLKVV